MSKKELEEVLKIYKNQLEALNGNWSIVDGNYVLISGNIKEIIDIIIAKYPQNIIDILKVKNKYFHQAFDNYQYLIKNKENLIIFLIEMEKYLSAKNNQKLQMKNPYQEIATVNKNIIQNFELEEKILNGYTLNDNIRKLLLEFDKAVNPFNDEVYLNNMEQYLDKLRINANYLKDNNEVVIQKINIIDLNNQSEVSFYQNLDTICYQLSYIIEDKKYLNVIHEYQEDTEILKIWYFGENSIFYKIEYDITHVQIKINNKIIKFTSNDINNIYNELLNAVLYARSITINNMNNSKLSLIKK